MLDSKDKKFYLFIDEVQFTTKVTDKENGNIEVTIYDMLNELKSYKNLDVYVTGSNSKALSSNIAEGGRYGEMLSKYRMEKTRVMNTEEQFYL